jgi:DNA-binding transcriptional MocR family regulator
MHQIILNLDKGSQIMERLFRYEKVATKIEDIIVRNHLKPGDKIPSVRDVVKELGVSIATVVQAYNILEAKGIVIPKPKSGYFVNSSQHNRLKPLVPLMISQVPATIEVNTMVTEMLKNIRKYAKIDFATMSPPPELMPITKINKAMINASKETSNGNYEYPYLEGHPRLLKQIALHTIGWNKSISQDDVLITNGCIEAISLCLSAVTKPGDIVAIECPTYPGILQCLESKGLRVFKIGVDPETGPNLDELEAGLNTNRIAACIFSPSLHNPVGCAMTEANKIRLVKMLGERNIPLIEDDALGEIYFGTNRPLPAKAYDEYDNVLYCSSFSKTLTPGFRIGWVIGGKRHADIERLKFSTNVSTNTVLQDTIGRYLESGNYHNHLKKLRAAVQAHVTKYRNAVSNYFPPETKISLPKGGYSLWIELPYGISALELQNLALRKGVAFSPGQVSSTSMNFYNYIRINCSLMYNNKIDHALYVLGELVYTQLKRSGKTSA